MYKFIITLTAVISLSGCFGPTIPLSEALAPPIKDYQLNAQEKIQLSKGLAGRDGYRLRTWGISEMIAPLAAKGNYEAMFYNLLSDNYSQDGNRLRAMTVTFELAQAGYPYALDSLSEEQICTIPRYQEVCGDYPYWQIKRQAYDQQVSVNVPLYFKSLLA